MNNTPMTRDEQLVATRDAMNVLRTRLSDMSHERLLRLEEVLCHEINESAGTPCHESCNLCR